MDWFLYNNGLLQEEVKKKLYLTACKTHLKIVILYCLVFILCHLHCVSRAVEEKLFILRIFKQISSYKRNFDMHAFKAFVYSFPGMRMAESRQILTHFVVSKFGDSGII